MNTIALVYVFSITLSSALNYADYDAFESSSSHSSSLPVSSFPRESEHRTESVLRPFDTGFEDSRAQRVERSRVRQSTEGGRSRRTRKSESNLEDEELERRALRGPSLVDVRKGLERNVESDGRWVNAIARRASKSRSPGYVARKNERVASELPEDVAIPESTVRRKQTGAERDGDGDGDDANDAGDERDPFSSSVNVPLDARSFYERYSDDVNREADVQGFLDEIKRRVISGEVDKFPGQPVAGQRRGRRRKLTSQQQGALLVETLRKKRNYTGDNRGHSADLQNSIMDMLGRSMFFERGVWKFGSKDCGRNDWIGGMTKRRVLERFVDERWTGWTS